MAVSNVYGLQRFREYMSGLEDCYAVIGGTACDILLRDADMSFRATKDIDIILLVEERLHDVGRAVWNMVKDGGYTFGWRSSEKTHFYRFTNPTEAGYPSMIELFSRSPDFITDVSGLTIIPLPIADEVSSLSAILLDEDYYRFMRGGRTTVDGITVLDAVHLVPFKARAYVDLSARRARGEHVNTRDLFSGLKNSRGQKWIIKNEKTPARPGVATRLSAAVNNISNCSSARRQNGISSSVPSGVARWSPRR